MSGLGFTIAQYAIFCLSLLAIGLLVIAGRTPERIAGAVFALVMFGAPFVDGLRMGQFRWGVAATGLILFASLLGLGLKVDRWWLLAASGVQLLSVILWIVSMGGDVQVWAAVTIRIVIWTQLMALALFGVWESRAAPYAKRSDQQPA